MKMFVMPCCISPKHTLNMVPIGGTCKYTAGEVTKDLLLCLCYADLEDQSTQEGLRIALQSFPGSFPAIGSYQTKLLRIAKGVRLQK